MITIPKIPKLFDQADAFKNTFSLTVNQKAYEGWKQVSAKRTMKALANGFTLSVSDTWSGQDTAWPIRMGDPCELAIDGDKILEGFVDSVNVSLGAEERSISVTGRCKAGDPVDCSAPDDPGEYKDLDLTRLCQRLLSPYGLTVQAQTDVGEKFAVWKTTPGESVFESLERAARQRAVLLYSDGLGKVLITRAGSDRLSIALKQGENLNYASAQYSMVDRFSTYKVKSQVGGFEEIEPEAAQSIEAEATDTQITRFRPKVLIAESQVDSAGAKKRARWEAAFRAGQSVSITAKVVGFRDENGDLWDVNKLVRITSPWIGVDTELLITEIEFSKGSGGDITTLTLEDPRVFQLLPEIPRGKQEDLFAGLGL